MSAAASPNPGAGRRAAIFVGLLALALILIFGFGNTGVLAGSVLLCALLGVPLFVIIGVLTVLAFWVVIGETSFNQYTILIEGARALADNDVLLAIPLFIMSGAIMSQGKISARLIDFAQALAGWMPGGLAVSGVLACMLFAAISGSSPATVVAIGAMMGPSLIAQGYNERFTHGLLTSAGSLGILIPPSIPMIVYPIVNQTDVIKVETLFASGLGPGLLMGSIMIGFSVYAGLVGNAARQPFSVSKLQETAVDGFWALMFPVLILGGIYGGIFYAVEAAAISVVYAVIVEIFVHRALSVKDVPRIFQETAIFLGALLVIMVVALAFNQFLADRQVPEAAVRWLTSLELSPVQFLLILNLMLLAVGMLMDILSAMLIFIPLLAPLAASMGIDPIHFGIIFIVNLEIGYLTPPVGVNLFVASTLYDRSLGHMIRSVLPFIALMLIGLAIITYLPAVSVGLGRAIMADPYVPRGAPARSLNDPEPLDDDGGMLEDDPAPTPGGVMTMEEMMRQADGEETEEAEEAEVEDTGGVMTMEEMMRMAEEE